MCQWIKDFWNYEIWGRERPEAHEAAPAQKPEEPKPVEKWEVEVTDEVIIDLARRERAARAAMHQFANSSNALNEQLWERVAVVYPESVNFNVTFSSGPKPRLFSMGIKKEEKK